MTLTLNNSSPLRESALVGAMWGAANMGCVEVTNPATGDLIGHVPDLAQSLTAEQGKLLTEARGKIGYGASVIEWFAEEARRACGDITPTNAPDQPILCIKQPVGMTAAITPWNFPNAMVASRAASARDDVMAVATTVQDIWEAIT